MPAKRPAVVPPDPKQRLVLGRRVEEWKSIIPSRIAACLLAPHRRSSSPVAGDAPGTTFVPPAKISLSQALSSLAIPVPILRPVRFEEPPNLSVSILTPAAPDLAPLVSPKPDTVPSTAGGRPTLMQVMARIPNANVSAALPAVSHHKAVVSVNEKEAQPLGTLCSPEPALAPVVVSVDLIGESSVPSSPVHRISSADSSLSVIPLQMVSCVWCVVCVFA